MYNACGKFPRGGGFVVASVLLLSRWTTSSAEQEPDTDIVSCCSLSAIVCLLQQRTRHPQGKFTDDPTDQFNDLTTDLTPPLNIDHRRSF